jgi:hypothetical protein
MSVELSSKMAKLKPPIITGGDQTANKDAGDYVMFGKLSLTRSYMLLTVGEVPEASSFV